MDLFAKICCLICMLLLTGLCVFLVCYFQTKKLRVREIVADEDSSSLAKICFISDLHFPMMFVDKALLIEKITSSRSDAIVIGGDLCHKKKSKKDCFEFLRNLAGENINTKIFVVLGNHDVKDMCDGNRVLVDVYKREVENLSSNIRVLENESEVLELFGANTKVRFIGLSDKSEKETSLNIPEYFKEEIKTTSIDEKIVVVCHNPDMILKIEDEIEKIGKNVLVLSGHTHGGQVWLPFRFEFKVLRKDLLPKRGYVYGLHQYNKFIKLFITCGLGCVMLPIRLGTVPEMSVIYC